VISPNADSDTIADKPAYEHAIADDLAGKLKAFDPEMGDYSIVVIGSYPDTKLQVSGRNIKTGRPMEWAFPLWELWRDWGNVNGTATVIYANMATSTFAGRCQATR
jgi:hypothetical protein